MNGFMNEDFLLSTETAKKLYHAYAEHLPIVDYHCHVNPREIYENTHFENIAQLWLGGDHYKWRVMRSNGIDERYITGDACDKEKFLAFAKTLPLAIGNPMYHWCHLELKRYFGYDGVLSEETAEYVWELTSKKLAEDKLGVRDIIKMSNVAFIGTTDDPIDTLEWHKKIAEEGGLPGTVVAPSFRPDKALNIDKAGWRDYIEKLEAASGEKITNVESIKRALFSRMRYFAENGCRASDHGLDYMCYRDSTDHEADHALEKVMAGEKPSLAEIESFKSVLLRFCAEKYAELGWVMQIHYNCMRNPNTAMMEKLGPDSGFDCIGPNNGSVALARFLDVLYKTNSLPKTVIYSLDAADNSFIDTLIGSFQGTEIAGKIQHGSAWWFNDNKQGMRDQLISLANLSLLGNFIGMLTDSRSFLSYTRHEYFRRILVALIGEWVENGEYPADEATLGNIISRICYDNAVKYFGLEDVK